MSSDLLKSYLKQQTLNLSVKKRSSVDERKSEARTKKRMQHVDDLGARRKKTKNLKHRSSIFSVSFHHFYHSTKTFIIAFLRVFRYDLPYIFVDENIPLVCFS